MKAAGANEQWKEKGKFVLVRIELAGCAKGWLCYLQWATDVQSLHESIFAHSIVPSYTRFEINIWAAKFC